MTPEQELTDYLRQNVESRKTLLGLAQRKLGAAERAAARVFIAAEPQLVDAVNKTKERNLTEALTAVSKAEALLELAELRLKLNAQEAL